MNAAPILAAAAVLLTSAAAPAAEPPAGQVKIAVPGVPYSWTTSPVQPVEARHVRVSTAGELRAALQSNPTDTVVELADGVYKLDQTIYMSHARKLWLRSAGGDRDKVVIQGPGMAHVEGRPKFSAIQWGPDCDGLEVANLTFRDFPYHGLHICGKNVRIFNCHFLDMGQQLVKVNATGEKRPEGGRLEYCLIEYTDRLWGGNYTQGISIVYGKDWTVRHCVFRNIRAAKGAGMGGPAILMWGGSEHMAAVGNVFVDCDSGIAFGIGKNAKRPFHLTDGLIAENVFVRTKAEPASDHGIALSNAKDVRIVHNTVWNASDSINWSIEYRFDCQDLLFANNLTSKQILRREGEHTNIRLAGNVLNTDPAWFVNLAANDLHLSAKAVGAIGKAVKLDADPMDGRTDIDDTPRPAEGADVGADQR